MKEEFEQRAQDLLQMCAEFIKQIEEADLQNAQFFLDFEDMLNLLSIKY